MTFPNLPVPGVVSVKVNNGGLSADNFHANFYTYQRDWLGYVPDFGSNSPNVYVFDIELETLIAQITTGGSECNDVGITPDGSIAYVVNSGSSSISVIDVSTNRVIGSVSAGASFPISMRLHLMGKKPSQLTMDQPV